MTTERDGERRRCNRYGIRRPFPQLNEEKQRKEDMRHWQVAVTVLDHHSSKCSVNYTAFFTFTFSELERVFECDWGHFLEFYCLFRINTVHLLTAIIVTPFLVTYSLRCSFFSVFTVACAARRPVLYTLHENSCISVRIRALDTINAYDFRGLSPVIYDLNGVMQSSDV